MYEASFVPVGANQDTGIVDVKDALRRLKTGRTLSQKNLDILSQIADDLTGQAKKLKDFVLRTSLSPTTTMMTMTRVTMRRHRMPVQPRTRSPQGPSPRSRTVFPKRKRCNSQ